MKPGYWRALFAELNDEHPAPDDVALRFCYRVLAALGDVDVSTFEKAAAGACDECGMHAHRRFVYGPRRLELCRRHTLSRARCAARHLAVAA